VRACGCTAAGALTLPGAPGILLESGQECLRFRYDGAAFDVKLSQDRRFVCIQRSLDTVVVLDLASRQEHAIETPAPTLLGGVVWMGDPTCGLALVTKQGLEVYARPAAGGGKWLPAGAARPAGGALSFWSLPARRLVLLGTGEGRDAGRTMRPFGLLLPRQPSKLAKFALPHAPSQGDLALVEMYGEPWAVHVLPSALQLYRIGQAQSQLVRTLRLSSPRGTCAISVVDSLLVAHSTSQKVSLVYDVRDAGWVLGRGAARR
jgi:hypothetical protein